MDEAATPSRKRHQTPIVTIIATMKRLSASAVPLANKRGKAVVEEDDEDAEESGDIECADSDTENAVPEGDEPTARSLHHAAASDKGAPPRRPPPPVGLCRPRPVLAGLAGLAGNGFGGFGGSGRLSLPAYKVRGVEYIDVP